jgi:hypothetical protein
MDGPPPAQVASVDRFRVLELGFQGTTQQRGAQHPHHCNCLTSRVSRTGAVHGVPLWGAILQKYRVCMLACVCVCVGVRAHFTFSRVFCPFAAMSTASAKSLTICGVTCTSSVLMSMAARPCSTTAHQIGRQPSDRQRNRPSDKQTADRSAGKNPSDRQTDRETGSAGNNAPGNKFYKPIRQKDRERRQQRSGKQIQ